MNQTAKHLLKKIKSHEALVGIIGLGYVGLPLALCFTEKNFNVLGFDIDPEKVNKLNRGENYIKHLDPTRLQRAVKVENCEGKTKTKNSKLHAVTARALFIRIMASSISAALLTPITTASTKPDCIV